MNDAFSFSISLGIIAFGIWIAAGAIGAGAHLAWILIGLLPVYCGLDQPLSGNSRNRELRR